MKRNNLLFISLILFCKTVLGQSNDRNKFYGKVIGDSTTVSGINILNVISGISTATNVNGEFSILAKPADVLLITAIHIQTQRKVVAFDDIARDLNIFKIQLKVTELKEVVVQESKINALSIGAMAKQPKRFTPAERKLQTAGDFKPIMLLGLLGGGMPLDPLINKINGRTKRLKRLIVLEKKELNFKILSEWFDENYYVNQLRIAPMYVNGFKYFIVENETFVKVLESRDRDKISFEMAKLALEYKVLLKTDNDPTNAK